MLKRDRTRAVDESLRRLGMVVDGVKSCVVLSDDGLAIAAYPPQALDRSPGDALNAAALAAVAARLDAQAARSLDRLALGGAGRLLLEAQKGALLCCPAGDVTLALLIEPGASMAHVLFAAQKAAEEIASVFDRE